MNIKIIYEGKFESYIIAKVKLCEKRKIKEENLQNYVKPRKNVRRKKNQPKL